MTWKTEKSVTKGVLTSVKSQEVKLLVSPTKLASGKFAEKNQDFESLTETIRFTRVCEFAPFWYRYRRFSRGSRHYLWTHGQNSGTTEWSQLSECRGAESVRSGQSHVASQPVFFPHHPDPGGMLSRSFAVPSRREGPPSTVGHTWYIGKRFCKSSRVFFSTLSSRIESMEFRKRRTDSLINGGEEWETNTSSRSEMPVWNGSQKFCHPQWGRLFKKLWCRPTTTADFRSSFRQIPHTSNVCLLEDKIQDWGMYLFTISYGSYALDQRSGDGWFSGLFIIFVICKRNSNAEFWSTRREDCFSAEQSHP